MVTLKTKWLEKVQPIEYENVGLFFQKCGQFGHLIVDCKAQMQKDKQKEGSPGIVFETLGESSEASKQVAEIHSMDIPPVLSTLDKNKVLGDG